MSFDQIFNKEFARRNLWEAVLLDPDGKDLEWSRGLIKSINIPKLQFTVEDIYGGSSKGYMGWKLPENLSLSIWETSDHQVEKYLDEWMTGDTGVLNPNKDFNGVRFRVQPENNIYRGIRIKTFIYEYVVGKPYNVKTQQHIKGVNEKFVDVPERTEVQQIPTVDEKQYMPEGGYNKPKPSPLSSIKELIPDVITPPEPI